MSIDHAEVCHINIDALELYYLDDKNFYQLVALEIIGQLIKMEPCEGLLNIPVPKNHHSFHLFLQAVYEVLPAGHAPILIVLHHPDALSEWRRERLSSLFALNRRGAMQKFGLVLA